MKLLRVNEVDVKDYVGFVYDDCHKIYLVKKENLEEVRSEWGENNKVYSMLDLEECYKNSCPLKFINEWDLKIDIVPQFTDKVSFEYDDRTTTIVNGEEI